MQIRHTQYFTYWEAAISQKPGYDLKITIFPDGEDPQSFIETAARLYLEAMKRQQFLLHEAVQKELLELYNDCWRQDDVVLTFDKFVRHLRLDAFSVDTTIPITLYYDAGDLFGGHAVAMDIDRNFVYQQYDLRG